MPVTFAHSADFGISGLIYIVMFGFIGAAHIALYMGYSLAATWWRLGEKRGAFLAALSIQPASLVVLLFVPSIPLALVLLSVASAVLAWVTTRQRLLALAPIAGAAAATGLAVIDAWLWAFIAWHTAALVLTLVWNDRHPVVSSPRSDPPRTPPAPESPCSSPARLPRSRG